MTPSTQLGDPVSARRAAWAGALGLATFAILSGARKGMFDRVMLSAFVVAFSTCVPLGLGAVEPGKARITNT